MPSFGCLIIDKPDGMTSHDVVARVRRAAGTRRVGHAGTLDPFATGVLICCIGKATRLVRFLSDLEKEYEATIRLGYATDTQDLTGKQITPLRTSNELSLEGLRDVVRKFAGPQLQMPPMFSAKKIAGERLYRAAREGREVERRPVGIVVHSFNILDDARFDTPNVDGTRDFRVRVRCSSGTYIRTLAHDIGEKIGVGAHLADLRRTRVGHFEVGDGLSLDELNRMTREEVEASMLSGSRMLTHLPMVELDQHRVALVMNGRSFSLSEREADAAAGGMPLRLCDGSGTLIGVGKYDQATKSVKPEVVMRVEETE